MFWGRATQEPSSPQLAGGLGPKRLHRNTRPHLLDAPCGLNTLSAVQTAFRLIERGPAAFSRVLA